MPSDRSANSDVRQRRMFQRLNVEAPFTTGPGISFTFDPVTNEFTLGVDIDPETAGILTFNAGGELTTQYITTSGALGAASVAIVADVDITIDAGTNLNLTAAGTISNTGSKFVVLTAGSVAITAGTSAQIEASGGIKFQDTSSYVDIAAATLLSLFGDSFTLTSGAGAAVSSSSKDMLAKGGPGSGANSPGGTVSVGGGQPTGTGTSKVVLFITTNAPATVNRIVCDINGIGFFGATPIAQPGTYTITNAPAVSTALNCDGNGGAYTGVGTASLIDLNDLRADVVSLAAVVRQLIKHLGDTSGLGLVNETAY